MQTLALKLLNDEAGFLISAELILISTVLVLGMVVGLSEVSRAVNQELNDLASAFGSVNQSYRYAGMFDDDDGSYGSDYSDSGYDMMCRGN
ncbi:MAG: branched-chain amino acid aminotransferase [Planctomycetota bacterium]|nr:branched-chain amino acid aminotransferase [Planctomycetota bacterium]MDA1165370.1 branched-chain amino acid aminotransferase [Planctomycetota bacterium]